VWHALSERKALKENGKDDAAQALAREIPKEKERYARRSTVAVY
jgi:predicted phage gp36 major capsid-like protein